VPVIGVVPAAGHARRLQPIHGSKEVFPIGGQPVLEYLVERMRVAEPDEIRVVTRPDKTDVIELVRRLGLAVHEARPQSPGESVSVALQDLAADDTVLLGFPDTIWEPVDGFCTLIDALPVAPDVALGLFRTAELERSDVVVLDAGGRVRSIAVKPATPPSDLIWGCAAARAGALAGLSRYPEPGALLDVLAHAQRVVGIYLSDTWLDIGTVEALSRAEGFLSRRRGGSPPR
jgi:glucose-1-phosphate thymidylyltransferase